MSQMNFGKATVKNGTSDLRLKDKRKNFIDKKPYQRGDEGAVSLSIKAIIAC